MRVSELSERSGVPVHTIKYYVREGLLPAGERVAGRLSEYDDEHLRRLRLLRALREVGGVPVARLLDVVAVVDTAASVHTMMGATADALAAEPGETDEESRRQADEVIARAGWDHVRAHARERLNLAALLLTAERHGTHLDPRAVDYYARVADGVARREVDVLARTTGDTAILERMVVGTVVYGELLLLLRRLAEEHHSHRRFALGEGG